MNLSESIGEPSTENKSPWNFSQNQPVFKQPMTSPPPVHRVSSSEPEFRVPVNPPYRPASDVAKTPHVPPEFRSEGKVKERAEQEENLPTKELSDDSSSYQGSSGALSMISMDDESRDDSCDAAPSKDRQHGAPKVSFTVGDEDKTSESTDQAPGNKENEEDEDDDDQ